MKKSSIVIQCGPYTATIRPVSGLSSHFALVFNFDIFCCVDSTGKLQIRREFLQAFITEQHMFSALSIMCVNPSRDMPTGSITVRLAEGARLESLYDFLLDLMDKELICQQ